MVETSNILDVLGTVLIDLHDASVKVIVLHEALGHYISNL